jgi:hypothetical protein
MERGKNETVKDGMKPAFQWTAALIALCLAQWSPKDNESELRWDHATRKWVAK